MYAMSISIQLYIKHTLSSRRRPRSPHLYDCLFFIPSLTTWLRSTPGALQGCSSWVLERWAQVKTPADIPEKLDCFPTPTRQLPQAITFSSKSYDYLFLASMHQASTECTTYTDGKDDEHKTIIIMKPHHLLLIKYNSWMLNVGKFIYHLRANDYRDF